MCVCRRPGERPEALQVDSVYSVLKGKLLKMSDWGKATVACFYFMPE